MATAINFTAKPNSAGAYWRQRKARETARRDYYAMLNANLKDMQRSDYLNRKCSCCNGPLTPNGYCVSDISKCQRAYTD